MVPELASGPTSEPVSTPASVPVSNRTYPRGARAGREVDGAAAGVAMGPLVPEGLAPAPRAGRSGGSRGRDATARAARTRTSAQQNAGTDASGPLLREVGGDIWGVDAPLASFALPEQLSDSDAEREVPRFARGMQDPREPRVLSADGGPMAERSARIARQLEIGPLAIVATIFARPAAADLRRARIDRFAELARRYRGWSRTQLSERLGREVGKIVPDSGVPKLDLIASIANALEWPLGDLAEAMWCDSSFDAPPPGRYSTLRIGRGRGSPSRRSAVPHATASTPPHEDQHGNAQGEVPRQRVPLLRETPLISAAINNGAVARAALLPDTDVVASGATTWANTGANSKVNTGAKTRAGTGVGTGQRRASQREAGAVDILEGESAGADRNLLTASETAIVDGSTDGESASEGSNEGPCADPSWAEVDLAACEAHRAGDAVRMLGLAEALRQQALTPTQRAIAAGREAGAWELRGCYSKSLSALQRGLDERDLRDDVRLMLEASLANNHCLLGHCIEARSLASDVIAAVHAVPRPGRLERVVGSFAHLVRGNALRQECGIQHAYAIDWRVRRDDDARGSHGEAATIAPWGLAVDRSLLMRARRDLERAREGYGRLAEDSLNESYAAMAHTARAAVVECSTLLGEVEPSSAMATVIEELGHAEDLDTIPHGEWLESYGWWAVHGCNIALHLLRGREFHRAMAVCTNKASEIAEVADNWALRERVFAMEHLRRTRVHQEVGFEPDWLLDGEDVRVLAGAMGRFPRFRAIGWRILESARLFEESA